MTTEQMRALYQVNFNPVTTDPHKPQNYEEALAAYDQALDIILKIYEHADDLTNADTYSMTVFEVISQIAQERDAACSALKKVVNENVQLENQLAAIREAWKANGCTMPLVYRCKMDAVINPKEGQG